MKIITNQQPSDWQSLQAEVGEILAQCGFTVEVEKTVETARGEVEIDVSAEETIKGRRYSVVCECKLWNSKIPQSVIHSFRTVVGDIGANKGYIISKNGFQSGSVKAVNYTNVELVTWESFQQEFAETWIENYFVPTITQELDKLLDYTEPLVQKWMCEIPNHEVDVVKGLREKYLPFAMVVMSCTSYVRIFNKHDRFPVLPLIDDSKFSKEGLKNIPNEIVEAVGYREFLNECLDYGKKGISEFQEVRKRNNV
jgi:hypothetical protein